MTKSVTTLDDKYTKTEGRVFLSSNQALVRLPMDQARRDRAAGLKTAGFISGYRGSPLGVYDAALWGAQKYLDEFDIRFNPGLNEELAATSIRGTQGLAWFGKSEYQGVFGLWYGKGLGVDRACESLKLGNLEGASATGGFLVLAGDDHGGKSSASAHQSEHTLIAGFIPVLYPANAAEMIEYGLYGWALSRFSGLYVGMKCITDTLDVTASVELPDIYRSFVTPDFPSPPGGRNVSDSKFPLELEALTLNHRHPAAQAFVRANPIDRVVISGPRRELGLVAAGKMYLDLRQALEDLGLDEARCQELGIGLYKPGLIWPMEPQGATAFSAGYKALLVIEEKRPVMEDQLARILFDLPADQRPALSGKLSLKGKALLSSVGELSTPQIRKAVYTVLNELGLADAAVTERYGFYHDLEGKAIVLGSGKARPAFFCSGCPHNTSTRVPDGSYAMSAVGCQGLSAYVMPERRTMLPMPMGGEGMPWLSVGPLVEREHMFQNMGDGTYSHSGLLAIRASVAAKSRITYKLLFNDAVAMTGGQPIEMHIGPMDMVNQLMSEGVSPVVLMSDDIEKYANVTLPQGASLRHRDELDNVQRELREELGVSAIVYEQTCATEKRRRRKRGTYPDPDKRVFINQDVCEGCGDCSVQSNCISVGPLETEFGRKRRIDQSTCNKDFSCVKGFCPSFVTVEGAKIATRGLADASHLDAMIATLPQPAVAPFNGVYSILVGGIGGTGVLTIGALVGMAAHIEGKGCTVLDMTGMAQKGGAVTSHIRVSNDGANDHSTRLSFGYTDVLLACDAIVGSGQDVLKTIRPGHTTAIVNEDVSPTGEFQTNRNADYGEDTLVGAVQAALRGGALFPVHASALATALIGDSIGTNVLMLGYAAQKGLLPVSVESLEEAIRLNGTFVKGNLRVFAFGRLAAHAPEELTKLLTPPSTKLEDMSLGEILESRTRLLTAYQNEAYAASYRDFVQEVENTLKTKGLTGAEVLVRDVALTLAKLMAYKDEYEVARLHSDPVFWERLRNQFDGDFKVKFHLAPPILPGRDASGRPKKRTFGAWMLPVFRVLAGMKGLRGTALDVFGYTAERRMERQLIDDYKAMIRDIVARVDQQHLHTAIELAEAAADVRGYGPVKEAAFAEYEARKASLLQDFASPVTAAATDTKEKMRV
ncbi:indolepyruvate ferredoxin oxidoreductase family protein [Novosphingobium sp. KCTC 2891]|uniref:indolepyruvate ferredoxin oxidoreductase family protein n=1 Tax=Novosphingobium sp. KCTC 2891 TaxID=2989730 RepID=UPI0022238743|nr:indolepyruvate ferredoxin oxidoreductase family protein [Novosphingobium sp. KCTC 2891]MCW1384874.1 indolepyruvate ferredoxin oxidoreductase family protein [Novosphingobium sp. KCTC 2891]